MTKDAVQMRRGLAIKKYENGESISALCKELNLSRQWFYNVLKELPKEDYEKVVLNHYSAEAKKHFTHS